MKAAAVVVMAQRSVSKETKRGKERQDKIQQLLAQARKLDIKDVAQPLALMRDHCNAIQTALLEQQQLLDGIKIMKARDEELESFIADMTTLQGRIDTAADFYNKLLKRARDCLKSTGDTFEAKLIRWIEKDSLGVQLLRTIFKQLAVNLVQSIK
jgi:hypothetical protein